MSGGRFPSLRQNLFGIWRDFYVDLTEGWQERRGTDKIPVLWLAPLAFFFAIWNSARACWDMLLFKVFHVAARHVGPALDPKHAAPYGRDLAERVVTKLQAQAIDSKGGHGAMAYRHRDYCGHGIFLENGIFRIADTYDGIGWDPMLTFESREHFVDWLAQQSDHSLDGYTGRGPFEDLHQGSNQRITRARLNAFVAGENPLSKSGHR